MKDKLNAENKVVTWPQRAWDIVAMAVIYYVTARLGQLLAIHPGNVTPVWLPSGIILAAVLVRGYHVWPGIFLGAFVGNAWAYFSSDSFLSIAKSIFSGTANGIGDVLCALVAAHLIERRIGTKNPFGGVGNIASFIAYGAILGPAISALFGITSLCAVGFIPWSKYTNSLLTWWTGDGIGVLILTPMLIAWAADRKRPDFSLEHALFTFTLLCTGAYSLGLLPFAQSEYLPLFALTPILMWAVFRFDQRLTFTAIFIVAAMTTIATAMGYSQFSDQELNESLIGLELFMSVMAVTVFLSHGVVVERQRTGEALHELNLELEERVKQRTAQLQIELAQREQAEKALTEYSERLQDMVEERTRELGDAHEQLLRQERLAVLGQLSGGIAHELRNPLATINNSAYFLNMTLQESDPKVKDALERLERGVRTCKEIINSLLDFASGKPPARQELSLEHVIQGTLSRVSIPENVQMTTRLDKELPTIQADAEQLKQIFGNLILNAIQAMTLSGGGQLTIQARDLDPGWVSISFADTGVGIPQENLEKIFEPLFTTRHKGIGLGLALVKMLVEGHGGSIQVQSAVGQGSAFTIKLPLVELERVSN